MKLIHIYDIDQYFRKLYVVQHLSLAKKHLKNYQRNILARLDLNQRPCLMPARSTQPSCSMIQRGEVFDCVVFFKVIKKL